MLCADVSKKETMITNITSLNPCFNGCYALMLMLGEHEKEIVHSLNPCFNGCYALI